MHLQTSERFDEEISAALWTSLNWLNATWVRISCRWVKYELIIATHWTSIRWNSYFNTSGIITNSLQLAWLYHCQLRHLKLSFLVVPWLNIHDITTSTENCVTSSYTENNGIRCYFNTHTQILRLRIMRLRELIKRMINFRKTSKIIFFSWVYIFIFLWFFIIFNFIIHILILNISKSQII